MPLESDGLSAAKRRKSTLVMQPASKKPRIAPGLFETLVLASGQRPHRILSEINTGSDPP
jgi:hypothetical protein